MRDASSILHVDMDSFFVSVEVLQDPTLQGKPVIVGGSGARGVVASCTYEARSYGVHSAMPSVRAQRLCPHAIFLSGRYDLYADYSKRIHEVFRSFTPLVEGISLDEAFLDVAGARRLFGTGEEIAHLVRKRIADDLGLGCAVGVAPSKFIAKLASKAAKPTAGRPGQGPVPGPGVVVVEPGQELEFLHPLPVSSLWGVGPATQKRLARFGIETIADLAALPLETLVGAVGKAAGHHLHDLAWARDDRAVEPDRAVKSISHEETYAHDLHDHDALAHEALRLGDAVAARLRAAGVAGRTVSIKVRFHDFNTITRSSTLASPTDLGTELTRTATALLEQIDPGPGVRLFGIAVSNLVPADAVQLSLDTGTAGHPHPGWGPATAAVDEIRKRFGDTAVGPAALADGSGLHLKRRGDTQWGPGTKDR